MTPIHLFNSLSKQKEIFVPKNEGHVSMYHCGPTVYNYAHIGNLRAYIATDILRRVFEFNDYSVSQIMNITDIGHLQHDDTDDGDDKMTLALRRENMELTRENMKLIALKYFDAFRADIERVNIQPANLYPFASDHIEDDISFIQILLDKGSAYATGDGIYFDTTSLAEYGRLGGISVDDAHTESRIGEAEIAKSKKKNIRDFALWKFNDTLGYDASFGKGFPGWHIECSVMSMKYLGGLKEFMGDWQNFETFDVHTGGVDHIPVHHNNEIAQTEAISGKPLAKYWLHNAHLIIEGGKKMAKSGEAFITLQTLEDKGISPLGFRYWVLGAGYRTPLQFSFEALESAERSYVNLVTRIGHIRNNIKNENMTMLSQNESLARFKSLINDDLNTPQALAFLYDIINNPAIDGVDKLHIIEEADKVFGLDLMDKSKEIENALKENLVVSDEISELAEKRVEAKEIKDWDTADKIREQIAALGYEIHDVNDGYYFTKKKLI
jgi:cysteinyl-tRNA synthetase